METEEIKTTFWDFKGAEEYTDKKLFMGSPYIMLLTLVSYLFFVLRCGPKFMANRPQYKLRKTIILYNACQVVYSAYMFHIGMSIILDGGFVESSCKMEDESMKYRIIDGAYLYFIAKLSELLDTIFFVLRKKWNQVSFLHVYHHSIMFFVTWVTLKYEPTYSFIFLGTINCFVHVIMYTYYCLSAFPRLQKYLWWKKHITKMQLVQFVVATFQVTWNFHTTPCPPSYILYSLIWSHFFIFTYLFTDFYVKSFKKKKVDKAQMEKSKEDARSSAYKKSID